MKTKSLQLALVLLLATSGFGQLSARNPVDELKDQVIEALTAAKVPFTEDQQKQLALLVEEERQAAENLFGITWDFSQGPPQGERRDQALAGIQWMYNELKKKIPSYMTDAQRAAWEKYESAYRPAAIYEQGTAKADAEKAAEKGKIQQIRVTNNAFNVETATSSGVAGPSGGGAKTEVIERGGAGAYHGNFASTFQDDQFNARNPFASNRPPYYERTVNGNLSGPVIRNRLSLNFTATDNKKENVGTVRAQLPEGPFSLGVTRPTLNRSYDVRGTLQLADAHSLNMGLQYASKDSKNENVGDFGLPERASGTQTQTYLVDLREISILSERTVHDLHFTLHKDHGETNPSSNALAVIVKDAFTGGGAQNQARNDADTYELSNLIYFAGEKLTMRSGLQAWHKQNHLFSEENFFGEYTFSDLASFQAGKPLKYRITCCEPSFDFTQTQVAFFSQNDLKLTKTFTLMLGLRYSVQTNIRDRNNFDPRIGFAYALGSATVIRGGAGNFTGWVDDDRIQLFQRLDGKHLYEIQIDNPGWPNPFASGSVRPRSRRVIDALERTQYYLTAQVSLERSLPKNLFVTVAYDINRGLRIGRTRDINAPLPATGIRPIPDEGQIIQMQSTGMSTHHHIKASMRQRFSIFNVNANYTYYTGDVDGLGPGNFELPTNSYNLHQDRGYPGNPHHTFNSSLNSRLPLDVYLTTVVSARSGQYYTVTTGKDDNKDGVINDRPAGVPKNTEVGPHYFDVSFNFSKAFELDRSGVGASGPQMNVFANLNNAFNMTHPGTPSGVMTSPFFGRSFNATSPRTIEVGMRFQF
jgi:hypothetical protein